MTFQKIINKAASKPEKLFLIDGLGAILSAFLLGVVLVRLESIIGMPRPILYKLALAPCFFAVYSLTNYLIKTKNWRPYLKAITLANLSYCAVTFVLTIQLHRELSSLGILYFVIEIIIVVALSLLEIKTAISKV